MKRILIPLLLALTAGCSADLSTDLSGFPNIRITDSDSLKVDLHLCCTAQSPTKGQYSGTDDSVNDICIFIYHDNILYDEQYCSGNSVTVRLGIGQEYTVFAMANTGKLEAPANLSDMDAFRIRIESVNDFKSKGLPMACQTRLVPKKSEGSVTLKMKRLVSRYSLTLSPELTETEYDVKSVRICQSALDITPFHDNSAPLSVGDGDYASSSDLTELNSGGTIEFYMLENCAGVLLDGNTNPWEKEPDNIGDDSGVCTYLEIGSKWSTQGANADMLLRMYLGQDNCSDFNIIRNSDVALTVCLDDSLSYKTTWKAFTYNLEDDREMNFTSKNLTVYKGNDWVEIPQLHLDPSNISYTANVSGAGLKVKTCEGKLYLKTEWSGSDEPTGKVSVLSWDGRHSASASVQAANPEFRIEDGAFISEGGSTNHSGELGMYYDWCGLVSLTDSEGTPLDASNFDTEKLLNGLEESFSTADIAGSRVELLGSTSGSDFAKIYLYGLGETDISSLTYNLQSDYGAASTKVNVFKAFPNISADARYYNMSVAPGDLRDYSTSLGIYPQGYPVPESSLTSWDVYHACSLIRAKDDYVNSMKIENGIMNFSPLETDTFPSCGIICASASTRNPHSNATISNDYTFELLLYVSIGLKADVLDGKNIYLRFAPFCEYATQEYDDTWAEHIPTALQVVGVKNKKYSFPMSRGEYAYNCGLATYIPGAGKPGAALFQKIDSKLSFDIWDSYNGNAVSQLSIYSMNPMLVNNKLYNASGEYGFYEFVRQYDIANLDSPQADYEGYQNYVIDAAYDLF